jgi:hypothetical protein
MFNLVISSSFNAIGRRNLEVRTMHECVRLINLSISLPISQALSGSNSVHNFIIISTPSSHSCDMPCMPRPPYSADLAPSDFYLFLIVKEKLERNQEAEDNQLFECFHDISRASITRN